MAEITERCRCGAEFTIQASVASMASLAASRWRGEHRCAPVTTVIEGDVTTEAHDAGPTDTGLGFVAPSMVDRWGEGGD